jgi:hypothetical protein
MPIKHRLIITVSVALLVVVLIVGAIIKAQQPYTQVILNLLNGQQYFGVPHVYQGDNYGKPTNQWPVYYGPSNASSYWSQGGISSDQPVLELTPAQTWSAGTMFWRETYSGGPVTITMVGTFSSGSSYSPDGFVIYLFLPSSSLTWGVSPTYNYSISYISAAGAGWGGDSYPSPIQGNVIFPQSSISYIVVQWDPVWQTAAFTSGATGQWNVFIVNNTKGNNPSVSPSLSPNIGSGYAGWDGIGTGAFQLNPGDRINITVTYDPSTNTLSGVATDLNHTGWEANFTLNLGNYYKPPSSGNYVFGVGAVTGDGYADWALLYVAMTTSIKPTPSALLTWIIAASVIVVVVVLIVALLMIKRGKR